jgi:hypothetical protein
MKGQYDAPLQEADEEKPQRADGEEGIQESLAR